MADLDSLAAEFEALRPRLLGAAYRLTGVRADAEDAVQEAWVRLSTLDAHKRDTIADLGAWLTRVVGRLCLDRLRSAQHRRESYVGQWLPEPIITRFDGSPAASPLDAVVQGDDIRLAAMIVLDRMTPEQRVAFVLHDAFQVPFAEIADVLGCSADSARQHASRGRRAIADADIPPAAPLPEQVEILGRFTSALLEGDIDAVLEVLHPDAVLIGDANGKAHTSAQIMVGADKISRFLMGLMRIYGEHLTGKLADFSADGAASGVTPMLVNGGFGVFVAPVPASDGRRSFDAHLDTLAIRDGKIVAIYDHANPDKLRAAGVMA